jgi:hypothetical protein
MSQFRCGLVRNDFMSQDQGFTEEYVKKSAPSDAASRTTRLASLLGMQQTCRKVRMCSKHRSVTRGRAEAVRYTRRWNSVYVFDLGAHRFERRVHLPDTLAKRT